MKRLFLVVILCNTLFNSKGQNADTKNYFSRQPLNLESIKSWYTVSGGELNNDGKYLYYYISNKPEGSVTLVIKSTRTDWQKEYVSGSEAAFTPDNKCIIFRLGTDSLFMLTLGTEKKSYLGSASYFKIMGYNDESWLTFLNKRLKNLILISLPSGDKYEIHSVSDYSFSGTNKTMLIATDTIKNDQTTHQLKLLGLTDMRSREIWSSTNRIPLSYSFDKQGSQIVFLTKLINEPTSQFDIWYYKEGLDSGKCILNSDNVESDWSISNQLPQFNWDGTKIFFGQVKKEATGNKSVPTKMEVWNYRDKQLQSVQMDDLRRSRTFTSVYSLVDKRIIRLENDFERIITIGGDSALIVHDLGIRGQFEAYWNPDAKLVYSLESIKDGKRTVLRDKVISYDGGVNISPEWKWGIYYDFQLHDYFSIDLKTGIRRNITRGCATSWEKSGNEYPMPHITGSPLWINNDNELILYDNYDVWSVDPTGIKKPVNLTNGYGKRHHIQFEVINSDKLQSGNLVPSTFVLLKAFNNDTKQYGFFRKTLSIKGDPELLSIGSFIYGQWNGYGTYNSPPVKAKDANVFLVWRMSATEAPNYFITNDFKTFTRVSDLQPQKLYNWYTTELHMWKSLDGTTLKGILYKPQNFDSTKKYPVIFDYYEKRSDELNLFITPKPSEGRINIPMFVSNGYCVFVPDIHYTIGWPGVSAYQAVVSAANYLSKFKWVDNKRMGLQGHSFGGYETNFIVTKTHLFAAACSASGFCDLISAYNSGARGGYPMFASENGQIRLGATPWQRPELYIQNSPIYRADKITTPLLLMNNKDDYVVPFAQGLELFVALRRLNKKVWMLEYDNGGHEVDGNDAEDFHIRMNQFFDHFLKGQPAPTWMSRGIKAKDKNIESGLGLDTSLKEADQVLNGKN